MEEEGVIGLNDGWDVGREEVQVQACTARCDFDCQCSDAFLVEAARMKMHSASEWYVEQYTQQNYGLQETYSSRAS